MSGINIDTIDLIDIFFEGKFNKYDEEYIAVSAFEISQCGIYLINSLPGYVYCKTDYSEIIMNAKNNGYLIDPITKEICQYRSCKRITTNNYPSRIKELINKIVCNYFETEEERKDNFKIKSFKIINA